MKYFINLDIKDSTILWRCHESQMVNVFLFEWSIVSKWVKYFSKNVRVTGQFGDEWKMVFIGSKQEMQHAIKSLSLALNVFVDVFPYKFPTNDLEKQTVNCAMYTKRVKQRKSLFRIGISTTSPKSAEKSEQKCKTNVVCSNSKVIDYSKEHASKNAFVMSIDPDEIRKLTKVTFKKENTFYVFTYQNLTNLKEIPGMKMIKSKVKNDKKIISYKTKNIDVFTKFVHACIKKNILYSSAYGPVYVPVKSTSDMTFLRSDDVYGDIVNTAAKVLAKMIDSPNR